MRYCPSGLVGMILLLASGALAAESGAPGVAVHYQAPRLTVQISEAVALRAVLEKVCQETRAKCDGLELVSEDVPAPLTLTGTWSEVISQLLEGVPVNYVRMPGRLLIQQRSAAAPDVGALRRESSQNGEKESDEQRSEAPSPPPRFMSEPGYGDEKGADDTREMNAAPTREDYSGGGAESSSGDSRSAAPPGFMGGPVNPTPYAGPRYSPFPDSNGNPILLNPGAPSNVSPFPDSRGMPVMLQPLPPGQKMGSPFPPATPPSAASPGSSSNAGRRQ